MPEQFPLYKTTVTVHYSMHTKQLISTHQKGLDSYKVIQGKGQVVKVLTFQTVYNSFKHFEHECSYVLM